MGQKLLEFTQSLAAVDDRTFTLTLTEPYGLVLESLGKLSSNVPFMMPERLATTDAFTQVTEPIGSGPFVFVKDEWIPGSKVVYVRNPDYVPRAGAAEFRRRGQAGARGSSGVACTSPTRRPHKRPLAAGEVDYYERPPVDLLPLMERDPGLIVAVIDPLGTQGWLRPNHLHPPFNRKEARQALLWMVNQEDYLRVIVGDPQFWRTCGSYFMCGTSLETDAASEALVQQDLDKARQLMQDAGYAGETIVLMDPTDIPLLHGASLVTAQMLKKIGVNVQVQAMDWSTLTSRRVEKKAPSEGGWHLFHTWATGADVASPVNNIGLSGGCEEKAWFGWPCDERLEKLRDELGAGHRRRAAKIHRRGVATRGLRHRAVRQLRPMVPADRVQQIPSGRHRFPGADLLEHFQGRAEVIQR